MKLFSIGKLVVRSFSGRFGRISAGPGVDVWQETEQD